MNHLRLVFACCFAAVSLPMMAFADPVLTGAELNRAGYSVFWEIALPVGNDPVRNAYLVDENLYVTTRSGTIHTVHADTGLARWVQDLDHAVLRDRAPTHVRTTDGGGPVLFVTHATAHVFDRSDGTLIRRLELSFPAGGGGVADAYSMYLGSAGGEMLALRWSVELGGADLVRWHARVRGIVTSTPVMKFDRVYFVSDGGVVYCLAAPSKALRWAYATGGVVAGGIHVDESGVYVASSDRMLYVLDPDTGERVHIHQLPGALTDAPEVAMRTVYQYSDGDGLFAFDTDTRQALWQMRDARRFVARSADNVVLGSLSGGLIFADHSSGRVTHRTDLPDGTMVVRNDRDAVLYLVTPDGRILCAKPSGFPYLRRDAVVRARVGASADAVGAESLSQPVSASRASVLDDSGDPLQSRRNR